MRKLCNECIRMLEDWEFFRGGRNESMCNECSKEKRRITAYLNRPVRRKIYKLEKSYKDIKPKPVTVSEKLEEMKNRIKKAGKWFRS